VNNPLVSLGLVTWNSAADLPACLDALAAQTYASIQLVVVDNASTDASLEIVRARCPDAVIIANAENRGYCGGHNQAIRATRGTFYMPLNPDVRMQPGYIAALVAVIHGDARVGMVAGRLYRLGEAGIIDSTGLFLDRKRRQYLRGHGESDRGQYDQPNEVFGADGAAPLYRRAMLDDVAVDGEYFDESFFSHKEDGDLAWRARLLGWRCLYAPDAVAHHRRSFRPGVREPMAPPIRVHAVKNRYLLLMKNETPAGWRRDWLTIIFYDLQILVYMLLAERTSLKALGMAWRLRPHARRWKAAIRARLRADPQELLTWFH
jgi:GT2 family glycosyltransferase